ncbi:hypothetical protein PG989_010365 [Apiospora arundinis]
MAKSLFFILVVNKSGTEPGCPQKRLHRALQDIHQHWAFSLVLFKFLPEFILGVMVKILQVRIKIKKSNTDNYTNNENSKIQKSQQA